MLPPDDPTTTTVSSSSSTEEVSPDEEGLEPKSFQGSNGSPAPTFPLRTFLKWSKLAF